ncbi:MAG: hypothetical protein AABX01_06890, partial [Candidatus Micrarchaeota archaeon]
FCMRLLAFSLLALSLIALSWGLSIEDQLSLRIREGENQTAIPFFALGNSYYLQLINCVPATLLVEKNGDLLPVGSGKVQEAIGEYIRRGYLGCANETLEFNSTILSILTSMPNRQIEAEGKIAAIEREGDLRDLRSRWRGLYLQVRSYRELEFIVLDSKFDSLGERLLNLRRVKSRTSIDRLSMDFDSEFFEAKTLVDQYESVLPYYFPAVAAYFNATLALKNSQRAFGVENPYLKSVERSLYSLDADLNSLELDLAIGFAPPPESFAAIAMRANELQKKAGQQGPKLPWYYPYVIALFCLILIGMAAFLRMRPPKIIISQDVPKIQKLLSKLRKIEQQEEEQA